MTAKLTAIRCRRRGRTAKNYVLEVAVTIVVLPAAGRYMSDGAVEQFIPQATDTALPTAVSGGSETP